MRRVWSLTSWGVTIGLILCWWVYRPTSIGGSTSFLVVSGHSMDGTYTTGDFVLVKEKAAYGVGDIVGFQVPEGEPGAGMIVIHRVIRIDDDGRYRTQGDNNDHADIWATHIDDVKGEAVARLAQGGRAVELMRHPLAISLMTGILATWAALGFTGKQEDDEDAGEPPTVAPEPLEPQPTRVG